MKTVYLTLSDYQELLRVGYIQVGDIHYDYDENDIFVISDNIDNIMNEDSEIPVQNKVIKKYIDDKTIIDDELDDDSVNLVTAAAMVDYISDKHVDVEESFDPTSNNTAENMAIKAYIDQFI